MLDVTFVRRRGERDAVYVTRADGSTTSWRFPTYGDRLPHDLVHLVVEEGLGLSEGFWGLVDRGVDVALVNNEATLVRDGRPLVETPGADFAGLVEAEAAVAALGGVGGRTDVGESEAVAAIGERLRELGEVWRDLPDGGSIRLSFATTAG